MQDEVGKRAGLAESEARDLCRRILEMSKAEATRVNIESGKRAFTRTATNRITTAGGSQDTQIQIRSVFGLRHATLTTNRLDDESLRRAVHDSEELARLAPEDRELLPELGEQEHLQAGGYYPSTADLTAEARARAAFQGVEMARKAGLVAAGYIDVRAGSSTVATSNGLFAHSHGTGAASTLTVRSPDGSSSGWAGDEAADWDRIESSRIAADAVRKCRDWSGSTTLEPGRYTVVLEATAVGMLLLRMMRALDARQADEGRSFFSKPGGGNRIGEKLFDASITLTSDPARQDAQTDAFDDEGLPIRPVVWVDKGRLLNLSRSRFWARQKQTEPLAQPSNLILSGSTTSLEEMIRTTKRGVLITRFWYIRGLNPRTISYTGLTRDGTFLIENGRLARPVNNFRFNQSLVELFRSVVALGEPVRVAAGENSSVGRPIVAPPLKADTFHLASVSEAI